MFRKVHWEGSWWDCWRSASQEAAVGLSGPNHGARCQTLVYLQIYVGTVATVNLAFERSISCAHWTLLEEWNHCSQFHSVCLWPTQLICSKGVTQSNGRLYFSLVNWEVWCFCWILEPFTLGFGQTENSLAACRPARLINLEMILTINYNMSSTHNVNYWLSSNNIQAWIAQL